MAQLGERRVRIAEAEGSNPFGSTILETRRNAGFSFIHAGFQHFLSLQILLFIAVFLHIVYTETTQ